MDAIFGGAGRDKINGQNGDDILVGGDGCDRIKGGRGNDLLIRGMVDNNFEDSSILDDVDAAMAEWAHGDLADTLSYLGPMVSDSEKHVGRKHRVR